MKQEEKQTLQKLRDKIDAIDDELMTLLSKRSSVVEDVRDFKINSNDEGCFIRAGRESEMIKNIYHKAISTNFPSKAAVAIWRIIISASTNIEQKLRIFVTSDSVNQDKGYIYWLVREYFGFFTDINVTDNPVATIKKIVNGEAEIAVFPTPRLEENKNDDTTKNLWWIDLPSEKKLRIFTIIPPIESCDGVSALAVNICEYDKTGDDVYFVRVSVSSRIHEARLKEIFLNAKIKLIGGCNKNGEYFYLFTAEFNKNIFSDSEAEDDRKFIMEKLKEDLGEDYISSELLGICGRQIKANKS